MDGLKDKGNGLNLESYLVRIYLIDREYYCMGCLEYSSPYNIEGMENFYFYDFAVRIVRNKEKCYNINIL